MHFVANFCRVKFAVLVSAMYLVALPEGATAYTLKTLYSFGTKAKQANGAYPFGGLIADPAGNLYGTTWEGGKNSVGIAFELVRPEGDSKWKFRVVHDFCSLENCADGAFPQAPLILDSGGNLYGVTSTNGAFELKPNANHTRWAVYPIYTFCADQPYCTDGDTPTYGGLTYRGAGAGGPYDGVSPLYGMTSGGGNGVGVVFSLTPNANGRWAEKVLHAFCASDGCTDGYYPGAGLVFDANGNMFGATQDSTGTYGGGVVFELTPSKHDKWAYQVLHVFGQNGVEEAYDPTDTPIIDSQGNLFGTTSHGDNGGAIFKLVPNGSESQVTQPYVFCAKEACSDGQMPYSGVVMDRTGALLGTTWQGGKQKQGVIYRYDGQLSVLYDFCRKRACSDGAHPSFGNLLLDSSGNIFGTTYNGGKGDVGTIFELSP